MTDKNSLLESIRTALSGRLGTCHPLEWSGNVAGGDINQAALISDGRTNWFLKYHQNAPGGMFATEARALAEMAKHGCIRVPEPVVHGRCGDTGYLVLEYLELTSNGSMELLGEQLAALHQVTACAHGWDGDNYIGSTPQDNTQRGDWTDFWRDHRLKPQLEMAWRAGFRGRLLKEGGKLLEALPRLLRGHQPSPSLLHGDLWSGNKAFTADGQPVIFDPASYHGDRETDIAMTGLFGGFGPDFLAGYQAVYPLPDSYPLRHDLYNLYHLLNHLNLFGSGYLSRCENIIGNLLARG